MGIIGKNGIGKSTAFNILTGALKPNLGKYDQEVKNEDIIKRYAHNSLGDYFKKLFNNEIIVSYKPQMIELIPKLYGGNVEKVLKHVDEKDKADYYLKELNAEQLKNKSLHDLSGGELQKVAIIATLVKKANIYYFDEPAAYLDITTRIKVAKLIRELKNENVAVLVIEHDLATLDYISDEIQISYGESGAYGIVSQSKAVRRGINEYMEGYLPDDNVRFRDYKIRFYQAPESKTVTSIKLFEFPEMKKSFDSFKLKINPGQINKGEVLAVMGANGLGKTTFLKLLAGLEKPDSGEVEKISLAYKSQYLKNDMDGTVRELLMKEAGNEFDSGWYQQNIVEKLGLHKLMENEIKNLSGGELQKFYIALTLSKNAKVLAFDEPSAFIDVEDRLKAAEVIKEFMLRKESCAIIVDHDVQFVDYIGDSMLVFEGQPGIEGSVYGPTNKEQGMNMVLKMLDITYRKDKDTNRPRINKPDSQLDKEQRFKGHYYA